MITGDPVPLGEYKVRDISYPFVFWCSGSKYIRAGFHFSACGAACLFASILPAPCQKFSLRQDWAEQLREMLEKEKSESAQSSIAFVQESQERIRAIQTKLQRLLDGYLEQDIEREIYHIEKAKLLSEKKSLEEQMARIEQKRTGWLEPMTEWIKEAEDLPKIARESNLFAKKVCAKEIFGSNLLLGEKSVRANAPDLDSFLANSPLDSGRNSGGNHWDALRASRMLASKKPISSLLVTLPGIEPGFPG